MAKRRTSRRTPWPAAFLAAAIIVTGTALGVWYSGRAVSTAPPPVVVPPVPRSHVQPAPKPKPARERGARPAPREGSGAGAHTVQKAALVAVIFDDAGGSLQDIEEIIAIGRPVTVAVLPGLRYSKEVAQRARAAGLDVFLHLPLEAEDTSRRLGPGAVRTAMNEEEIAVAVRADLSAVPGAIGVNNHMGSRGTADERVMRAVLQVVKERGLIFVDSVTSGRSLAASLAEEMGIPSGRRHVFLDNSDDHASIQAQLRALMNIARRRGSAIAVGHAQRTTPLVLKEMLPEFDRLGIELVFVSKIVR